MIDSLSNIKNSNDNIFSNEKTKNKSVNTENSEIIDSIINLKKVSSKGDLYNLY